MNYTLCLVSAVDQEAAAAVNPNLMIFDAALCDYPGDPVDASPTAYASNGAFSQQAKDYISEAYDAIESFDTVDWNSEETSFESVLAERDLQPVQYS